MARVLTPLGLTPDVQSVLSQALPFIPSDELPGWHALHHGTPYLVSTSGVPMFSANDYLRKRHTGKLHNYSLRSLADNSIEAFAYDLAYFLNTYQEPTPEVLRMQWEENDLLTSYSKHLEGDAELSASTIMRRKLVASEYLGHLFSEDAQAILEIESAGKIRSTLIGDSGRIITYFSTRSTPASRRRSPSTIVILPPNVLRDFFSAFADPIQRSIAKIIYATGMRRSEVCDLTVSQIASLRPAYAGGLARLKIVGKGNKERIIDIEPPAISLFSLILTSKERFRKLKRGPYYAIRDVSTVPLFLNRFGKKMSGRAVGDYFLNVSRRTGIIRSPHELRHEFATNYLLNAYRDEAKKLRSHGLQEWLARLQIEESSLAIVNLARILGHSSYQFTKETYVAPLFKADPSIREAWNNHLDQVNVSSL